MKLLGVEIPDDIEIPELDAENKAELDGLHEFFIRREEEIKRSLAESPFKEIIAKMKVAPQPPDSGRPVTISMKALRMLPPLARARVLYVLRDQLSD